MNFNNLRENTMTVLQNSVKQIASQFITPTLLTDSRSTIIAPEPQHVCFEAICKIVVPHIVDQWKQKYEKGQEVLPDNAGMAQGMLVKGRNIMASVSKLGSMFSSQMTLGAYVASAQMLVNLVESLIQNFFELVMDILPTDMLANDEVFREAIFSPEFICASVDRLFTPQVAGEVKNVLFNMHGAHLDFTPQGNDLVMIVNNVSVPRDFTIMRMLILCGHVIYLNENVSPQYTILELLNGLNCQLQQLLVYRLLGDRMGQLMALYGETSV